MPLFTPAAPGPRGVLAAGSKFEPRWHQKSSHYLPLMHAVTISQTSYGRLADFGEFLTSHAWRFGEASCELGLSGLQGNQSGAIPCCGYCTAPGPALNVNLPHSAASSSSPPKPALQPAELIESRSRLQPSVVAACNHLQSPASHPM